MNLLALIRFFSLCINMVKYEECLSLAQIKIGLSWCARGFYDPCLLLKEGEYTYAFNDTNPTDGWMVSLNLGL